IIQSTFIGSIARRNLAQHSFRIFGVTACLTVRAPLDVDESLDAVALFQQAVLVFAVIATIPAGPDRRRIIHPGYRARSHSVESGSAWSCRADVPGHAS